ncbi:MAG: glycoside hydrolase family 97 N-terminal domain-containing protein, partial [Bacteroidia bacterium]|nr:glycoside hydrolase family 97 N-terminal domain-containing protein [Bacteroidia bacterium]
MKNQIKFLFTSLIIWQLINLPSMQAAQSQIDISSPDGAIHFLLATNNNQLTFTVTMNGKVIVDESPLYMSVDGEEITGDVKAGRVKTLSVYGTYPLYGLHSKAVNMCNGMIFSYKNIKNKIKYNIEVRVFNDAVAFRFMVPGKEESVRYPDESTVFRLPSKSITWYHDLYMHYEGVHAKKMIDTIPEGQWAAPPLTVKLPDNAGYLAITESDLINYAGMALQSDGKNGFVVRLGHSHPASYPYVLRYKKEDVERLSKIAEVKGTITTPWRVIIAGKDLNTLVNSDAVYNLCPPPDTTLFPDGAKTEWIKPGRAVWRYLDGGGDQTLKNMKEFSRQASELGFEYNILENFWSKWPEDSVKALVDYSKKLGVGIILWRHSNTLHNQKARQELFHKCHDLGIAGLKIDFF